MEFVVNVVDVPLYRFLADEKFGCNFFIEKSSGKEIEDYSFGKGQIYLSDPKQMPGRMADTLLYLFNNVFESEKFTSELNKQDLADLSGMSKESAVKVLRGFQKEGIINISDHDVSLLNMDALKRISKTG